MQAAVFKGAGRPLEIESRELPVPGAGEVLIKVGRCGICGTDLSMTDGSGALYEIDSVIGHEFAGEIVALGRDVDSLKIGDRISAMPYVGCGHCNVCRSGRPNFCSAFRGMVGGFGQYLLTAERVAIRLPRSLSLADGALVEPLATSLHGILRGKLQTGARLLVIGAGPIGLGAVYWGKRLGAGTVAVTARSSSHESIARSMGADAFVISQASADHANDVARALNGMPDLVVEAVGKPGLINQAVECVRPGGTVVVIGFCSVPDTFVPALAVYKEVQLYFSMTYSLSEFEHAARVLDVGAVECRHMITGTVGLTQLPDAFEKLRSRSTQCKVMVNPWA